MDGYNIRSVYRLTVGFSRGTSSAPIITDLSLFNPAGGGFMPSLSEDMPTETSKAFYSTSRNMFSLVIDSTVIEPGNEKMCFMPYANNKRRRSACASAQSDHRLYCSLPRQNDTSSLYIRNFKILADHRS